MRKQFAVVTPCKGLFEQYVTVGSRMFPCCRAINIKHRPLSDFSDALCAKESQGVGEDGSSWRKLWQTHSRHTITGQACESQRLCDQQDNSFKQLYNVWVSEDQFQLWREDLQLRELDSELSSGMNVNNRVQQAESLVCCSGQQSWRLLLDGHSVCLSSSHTIGSICVWWCF